MPKRRLSLRVRIPPYETPRNAWRCSINEIVSQAQARLGVEYNEDDRLEVRIRLYLDKRAIITHDVDNRVKDILDALQGRAGGSKAERSLPRIVPNDWQIFRVSVDECIPPPQSLGLGHLIIRKYRFNKAV